MVAIKIIILKQCDASTLILQSTNKLTPISFFHKMIAFNDLLVIGRK